VLWKVRTEFEKIYARAITADVEVIVEQPAGFKAQLGEIMSAVVTHEDQAARF